MSDRLSEFEQEFTHTSSGRIRCVEGGDDEGMETRATSVTDSSKLSGNTMILALTTTKTRADNDFLIFSDEIDGGDVV